MLKKVAHQALQSWMVLLVTAICKLQRPTVRNLVLRHAQKASFVCVCGDLSLVDALSPDRGMLCLYAPKKQAKKEEPSSFGLAFVTIQQDECCVSEAA